MNTGMAGLWPTLPLLLLLGLGGVLIAPVLALELTLLEGVAALLLTLGRPVVDLGVLFVLELLRIRVSMGVALLASRALLELPGVDDLFAPTVVGLVVGDILLVLVLVTAVLFDRRTSLSASRTSFSSSLKSKSSWDRLLRRCYQTTKPSINQSNETTSAKAMK